MAAPTSESTYRIGAIARLTGIPSDTLRVWERRYQVVTPVRSPKGTRLYSREDVARLALIKRLVDAGQAIGSVARLSLGQLEERLATLASPAPRRGRGAEPVRRVALLGDALAGALAADPQFREGLDLVVVERDPVRFREALREARPDLLVLEYPTVHEETAAQVTALLGVAGARRALVIYGFGRGESVRRLDTTRTTPLRAPVAAAELRRWCVAATASAPVAAAVAGPIPTLGEAPPARRFDPETLARLAGASTTVRCECPHHLVQLVYDLSAFERYSAECESRSPEDSALHAYLHLTVARARALVEEALARLAAAEGLDAPAAAAGPG
jgi:DNA-binding transcriptional MerR regulator